MHHSNWFWYFDWMMIGFYDPFSVVFHTYSVHSIESFLSFPLCSYPLPFSSHTCFRGKLLPFSIIVYESYLCDFYEVYIFIYYYRHRSVKIFYIEIEHGPATFAFALSKECVLCSLFSWLTAWLNVRFIFIIWNQGTITSDYNLSDDSPYDKHIYSPCQIDVIWYTIAIC